MLLFAIKDGNWSDPTIWCYQEVPGVEDVVYSSGKNVTIDTDVTCQLITTDSPIEGQFVGGEFILEDSLVFVGNIAANSNTCLKSSIPPCSLNPEYKNTGPLQRSTFFNIL